MRKRWILIAIVALIAAGVGWYFASPAWTLKQMAHAGQARDADKLSAYIDYPKLRESSKSQLKAAITAQITSGHHNGFEALGMMIGMSMVDNMIDGVLSPEGMEAMFAAQQRKVAGPQPANKPFGLDASNREIVHNGIDRFRLHEKGKPGQDGDLIFERHGLSWKLAEIKLPNDLLEKKP